MLLFYRILINLVLILSPIIILFRLIKKKEDPKRFFEKFGFPSKKRLSGKVIWQSMKPGEKFQNNEICLVRVKS